MVFNGYKIEPKANLRWADLGGADLSGADLSGADLRWADLGGASLSKANLDNASLMNCAGDNKFIRSIQSGKYVIVLAYGVMQIGCERHSISDWWEFSDDEIAKMDTDALNWWKKWKPILKQIVGLDEDSA